MIKQVVEAGFGKVRDGKTTGTIVVQRDINRVNVRATKEPLELPQGTQFDGVHYQIIARDLLRLSGLVSPPITGTES